MNGGRSIDRLQPRDCVMIWRNLDGIEDFYKYTYQGLKPVIIYQYSNNTRVYYTREQLETLIGEKNIDFDGQRYLVPDDYDDNDVLEDVKGEGFGLAKRYVREEDLYYFHPDEPELKPVVVMELGNILKYGVRECDMSSFEEHLRTGNHIPYNHHQHPQTQLLSLDKIEPSRPRESLKESRSQRLQKGIEMGYDLSPVVINSKGNIIDGNHRYYLSKDLGYNQIPVLYDR